VTGPARRRPRQQSLLSLADLAALYPPGMVPDPQVMTRYVTGVQDGWHAIDREDLEHPFGEEPHLVAWTVCGLLALASKHGVYDRAGWPVQSRPCPQCAWHVAIATGSINREIALLTPDRREARALARCGVTPRTAVAVCQAILAAAADPAHPAVVRQLAAATAHRPDLSIPEDCAEGSCEHRPARLADMRSWRCNYPDALPVCWACTLTHGSWAGEGEGTALEECTVPAPCSVLLAQAAHYRLIRGRSRRPET